MAELGDGHNKEFWLEYLQNVETDSDQRASTYTVSSWCQEIGNFNSIESPSQVRAGIISCWNFWFTDLFRDYPELSRTLNKAKFFSRSIIFLRKLNRISNITHRKIFQLNRRYSFHKTFENFDKIIGSSIHILRHSFSGQHFERSWRTLNDTPVIKHLILQIITKIDPAIGNFREYPAESE